MGSEFDINFQVRQSTSLTGCVRWSDCWLVGRITHLFDDPHVAPYWPTWPCFLYVKEFSHFRAYSKNSVYSDSHTSINEANPGRFYGSLGFFLAVSASPPVSVMHH